MSTPTLGINFGTHDAAAAVVHQGRVLAAVEEERLTRVKHTKAFPSHAIRYCLDQAGLSPDDVDEVALFVDPRLQLLLAPANLVAGFPASLGSLGSDLDKYRKRRRLPAVVRASGLLRSDVRVVPVPHHRAHAASAYLTSPFEDALVVTLDGRGEFETACVFDGARGRLKMRQRVVYPHSFGYLYSMITRYLGFRPQNDEYKVMGLAAHGTPQLLDKVSRLARVDPTGKLHLDLRFFDHHRRPSQARALFSQDLVELLGPPRLPGETIADRHRDVAYATQRLLETLVLAFLHHARSLTPHRNLCLAGGVALNCVVNQQVIESGLFDGVYIQPAAGDPGTAVGAALLVNARHTPGPRARTSWTHAHLGPEFAEADVVEAIRGLANRGYRVERVEDAARTAARLLADGKVIGWFHGRAEFGPRALGARSILAPAHDPAITERINALIKRRELFRPLAPAVLAERARDYFTLHPAGQDVYPFMLATADVLPEAREAIPAVVHADGTARVQTVHRRATPAFWALIEHFRSLTGIPVVLNTSFNEADEPIVNTPSDAVRTFTTCRLDALVIGDFAITPTTLQ